MSDLESYFLPDGYEVNPPASSDADGTAFWEGGLDHNDVRYQVPVYRYAKRVAERRRDAVVLDIGCGSGDKLHEFFGRGKRRVVGVDQGSGIALASDRFAGIDWIDGDLARDDVWADLKAISPDLIICADVIEHVEDPVELLHRLQSLMSPGTALILSTPDRSRLEASQLGPPGNQRHIREWSKDELARLVSHVGFEVRQHLNVLPRRYSWSVLEAKQVVWRALHAKPIPDARSCQILRLSL